MRRIALCSAVVIAPAFLAARSASAALEYVALGDSVTFGEMDLNYEPSGGDRGYVGLVANQLASRNGGVRPQVVNLAIDGETAASFTSAAGRVTPVNGRTDAILAAENLNYAGTTSVSQSVKLAQTVAAARTAGNTISTVSITLGFNDLSTAVGQPASAIPGILAAYQAQYAADLASIRAQLPTANLLVLGYYNPFPANPASPAAPIFNAYGMQLNGIIQSLAGQYGGTFVNPAPAFVGNEAAYTYIAAQPAGSTSPAGGPYVGVEPIGNVHPNAIGYASIAGSIAAVPEPATVAALALAGGVLVGRRRRR